MIKNNSHLKSVIRLLFSKPGTLLFLTANTALLLLFFAKDLNAQANMSNGFYNIQWPNLNSFAGKPSNSQYNLGITGGQIAPGLYSGSNYKVRAGFQYINSIIPFSFSISSIFIDFGPITPGAPVTRTNNLTISNGSAFGYTVLARENHPLRVLSTGASIPDTTCDTGTCTQTTSAAWTNLTTFGFGYRCDNVNGTDCATGFTSSDNYKQFASSESAELAQPVMNGVNVGRDIEVQITYKVNISATQPAGNYQNLINFVAIPSI